MPLPSQDARAACPTCGQAVQVSTSDEGTSYYVGLDAWDAHTLRTERDAAILSVTMGLREALRDLVQEFEAYAGQDAPLSGYYRQAKAVLSA